MPNNTWYSKNSTEGLITKLENTTGADELLNQHLKGMSDLEEEGEKESTAAAQAMSF